MVVRDEELHHGPPLLLGGGLGGRCGCRLVERDPLADRRAPQGSLLLQTQDFTGGLLR